jgi:hypothetical protein
MQKVVEGKELAAAKSTAGQELQKLTAGFGITGFNRGGIICKVVVCLKATMLKATVGNYGQLHVSKSSVTE